jgi:hypothetical protein
MEKPITYVGLDVHKDTIAIALAEADKRKAGFAVMPAGRRGITPRCSATALASPARANIGSGRIGQRRSWGAWGFEGRTG